MKRTPVQYAPTAQRPPLVDRAAMYLLAALVCIAGVGQTPVSGMGAAGPDVGAPAGSMLIGACRGRLSSGRSEWNGSSVSLPLASDAGRRGGPSPAADDGDGPAPFGHFAPGAAVPVTAGISLLAPVHAVSECARRAMRTSGRHPPQ